DMTWLSELARLLVEGQLAHEKAAGARTPTATADAEIIGDAVSNGDTADVRPLSPTARLPRPPRAA
ncbi:MAG: hypothetical protein M3O78_05070, partial [Chloroflexota bacterium]|nr:hypothetical protein [Chloroflexota bacterium]